MKILRVIKSLAIVTVLTGMGVAGYWTRERWLPLLQPPKFHDSFESADDTTALVTKVIVNEHAQVNLGLTAKPLKVQNYWKTIPVPGMVVDRPGLSDRGVSAPVTGVVAKIAHVPGDSVRPGDVLFTLTVLSDSLHLTQADLFKATQGIAQAEAQKKRLKDAAGAVSMANAIEVDNQIARLEVAVKAYRQELLSRGFTPSQIDGVTAGTFVREISVFAGSSQLPVASDTSAAATAATTNSQLTTNNYPLSTISYEVQELKVDLGQQVQAGQTLCTLANHHILAIEGRAFRDETPLLERSVREKWPVEVDFQEDATADWGEVKQSFRIRQMSNTIDPLNRTFAFLIPMENESRVVVDEGRSLTLWRYRPGQRVRLLVRVQELTNVFVLPADAVARDGPEAFVFTQNVNTFERKSVRVLMQHRQQVILANDGSLLPGSYVAQAGAVQLNRMVKAGGTSGVPKGYHLHADGSLHKNEE